MHQANILKWVVRKTLFIMLPTLQHSHDSLLLHNWTDTFHTRVKHNSSDHTKKGGSTEIRQSNVEYIYTYNYSRMCSFCTELFVTPVERLKHSDVVSFGSFSQSSKQHSSEADNRQTNNSCHGNLCFHRQFPYLFLTL